MASSASSSSSCPIFVPLSVSATEDSFHLHSSSRTMRSLLPPSSCHCALKISAKKNRFESAGKARAFAMDLADSDQALAKRKSLGASSFLPSGYGLGNARAFAMDPAEEEDEEEEEGGGGEALDASGNARSFSKKLVEEAMDGVGAGKARGFSTDLAEEAMDSIDERQVLGSKRRSPRSPLSSHPSFYGDHEGEDRRRENRGGLLLASPPPPPPKNRADDPSLHNPLQRLHRMGSGYLSVIVEWDGVIVEEDSKLDRDSWLALAREEARPAPLAFLLRKMEGMKSEQAIAEVLCWSRDPTELRRLAARRDELFRELRGGSMSYQLKLGSIEFLRTLKAYDVPVALVSPRPRKLLEEAMEALPSLQGLFRALVSAEDVCRGKPDPEMYMYAAQLLGFIPERCIVVGSSNSSVEGAHDTFMKCIAVSGKHPVYELAAADLVVARLDDLSFVDLKNLADLDSPEFQPPEPQAELEADEDVEAPLPRTSIALADRW